jgi:hypothetical protein
MTHPSKKPRPPKKQALVADDDAPEFTCLDEDPVIVNLTDDERSQLEGTI